MTTRDPATQLHEAFEQAIKTRQEAVVKFSLEFSKKDLKWGYVIHGSDGRDCMMSCRRYTSADAAVEDLKQDFPTWDFTIYGKEEQP